MDRELSTVVAAPLFNHVTVSALILSMSHRSCRDFGYLFIIVGVSVIRPLPHTSHPAYRD